MGGGVGCGGTRTKTTIFELSFKQVMGGNVPAGLLELRELTDQVE